MADKAFLQDWSERYKNGTCTEDHLRRLNKIGRITAEELASILALKKQEEVI